MKPMLDPKRDLKGATPTAPLESYYFNLAHYPHLEHMYRPSPSRQPVSRPQPEQAKPAGHRSHSR